MVGAGPAGSTVAFELARQGHSVRIVEEHPEVGEPVQCAGLVSQRVLDLAGAPPVVRRPVRGATVFGPSMGSLRFRAETPRAFVIDRAGLDRHLADRALAAGAELVRSVQFLDLRPGTGGRNVVRLRASTGAISEVEARLVVGADGVASAVARAARLRRPVEILPAVEAEFAESPGDPEEVEIYLGNAISPGLFGWWIPDGAGGARVGVAISPGPTPARAYLDRLRAAIERRHGRALPAPTRLLVSGIPIGRVPRTTADGVLLVGDAAAQVKPLSGGGIFTGMRCAQLAAETAHRGLSAGDLSDRSLAAYDRAWRQEFEEEFERASYLRRILLRMSDPDLDRLVAALSTADLRGTIVAFGDIDFPSHVARQLLVRSPSLVRFFPKALGALWGAGPSVAPELDLSRRLQNP